MYSFHQPATELPLDKAVKIGERHYLLKRDAQLVYEVTDYGTPQTRFIKKMSFKLSDSGSSPRLSSSPSSPTTTLVAEPNFYQFLMEKEEVAVFNAAIDQLL